MERVQLVSTHDVVDFIDMMPASVLRGRQFCVTPPADWLVVFDDVGPDFVTSVPRERRISVITEPPGFKTYWPKFLDQFGIVVTPFETLRISGTRILSQPGVGWFYGRDFSKPNQPRAFDYQMLLAMKPPPKVAKLSAVLYIIHLTLRPQRSPSIGNRS